MISRNTKLCSAQRSIAGNSQRVAFWLAAVFGCGCGVLARVDGPRGNGWEATHQSTIAQPKSTTKLSDKELAKLWQDLGGGDARAAHQALWQLVASPQQAVATLDLHLKKVPAPDMHVIQRLIAELDSESYAIRVQASAALEKIGMPARPALEQALADPPSPESYLRAKQLVYKLSWLTLSPQEVQTWRAIEALEYIAGADARQVLQRLSKGHPNLWQTRQAQHALDRLQQTSPALVLAKDIKEIALLEGHTSRVYGLAFSPDGKLLASAGADGLVRLWDAVDGKPITSLLHPSGVWSVAFTADGKSLASACTDQVVRVWDVATRKLVHALAGHDGIVYGVAIGPDGQFLASAGSDKTVRLWEVASGKMLAILDGHQATVWGVEFSPDGKTLVSASSDKTVKLWEVISGKERASFGEHATFTRAAAFSADGKAVMSCDSEGWCKFWDVPAEKLQLATQAHPVGIRHLTSGPAAQLFATAGEDGIVKLWNAAGKEVAALEAHLDKARCVAFRPDGQVLATGSYDKTIKLWRVAAP